MRADPCLLCGALNTRRDEAPRPPHCPRCGRPLPVVDPRTGRWPRPRRHEASALVAFVRTELRQPCPHGIPRDQPCATCSEEVPF